ncbi:MAG: hypothetical protein QM489_05690 [Candidatus Izemoplasma sp.]
MRFFKKKNEVTVDDRTNIEKTFENKGQKIGRETGELVQKGVDKINHLKDKYDVDEKFEEILEKATTKSKKVIKKVKNKTIKRSKKTEDK